ncbi:flagellar basal body-associated protein FliL [Sulfurimonas sp. MAG313]|nr:flagellar basal body-associated protein FliL [Sulfurimonas sp. MAG313]MDF1879769.1 flagellar basal body-associated protein FliL [Sulfurimonas sp. MAG313]
MAEEESTEQSNEDGATPAPQKGSNLVLIIIAVVLVLVLAIVGVVVVMLMSGGDEQSQSSGGSQMTKEKPMKMMDAMEVGPMFPLDTFTVNLLSDSGRRYLKVQINLELDGEELAAELESKTAVIRDVCIRLLSSKTLEEISTAKGKEKLKEQIVNQLNLRLRDGNIRHIYFTEFVVQ